MIKTIAKIGNSHGVILDAALLDLARLKPGDQVNVTVHESGTITFEPMRPQVPPEVFTQTVKDVIKEYDATLRKLS
jgi:antitoxin component of MazEF toxin-antitoxin module